MIDRSLVLVVGAGASAEYGMPVGAELTRRVAALLSFDDRSPTQAAEASLFAKVVTDIAPNAFGDNRIVAARLSAATKQFTSIDEALHFAADTEVAVRLGKLAIAQSIVSAESQIADSVHPRGGLHSDRYLTHLLNLATSGRKRADHERFFERLSIVNFNYDRIIEHVLYSALVDYFELTREAAREAIERITIIRPYGSIGDLPWKRGGSHPLEFGPRRRHSEIISTASQTIRTFTEGVTDTGVQEKISSIIEQASTAIILGFGYHAQNLSLLRARGFHSFSDTMQVFATVSGIEQNNHARLRQALAERFGLRPNNHPQSLNMRAAEMLSALRFSIAAALTA